MSANAVRFYRELVTALPGQGFREWFYYPEEKKVDSWPLLGWAIYHEKAERHECEEDGCECEGDDSAIVVALSVDVEGYVEKVMDGPRHVGILPEGQAFTAGEAALIYAQKLKEENERFARAKARRESA